MDNSKLYLLKKIIGYETNGLKSLGQLNACHIDDVSKVMVYFAEEVIMEVIEAINEGKSVEINGKIISLKRKKV